MKFAIPSLAGAALLALALGSTAAHAADVSLTLAGNYAERSQVGTVNAYSDPAGSTVSASSGSVYVGSYKLTNNQWVYCLSPFTHAAGTAQYTPVTMASFFGANGGYEQQFNLTNPNYSGLAPGYNNQDGITVANKIVALFNWAYAHTLTDTALGGGNSLTVAEKSAAFAYALWEIEGESGAYGTSAGGLRLSGVNADVLGYASTLLANVTSGTWSGFSYQAYDFTVYQANPISSSQSFVTVTQSNQNRTGIPEPSTLMLLAASGLALVVSRRKAPAAA